MRKMLSAWDLREAVLHEVSQNPAARLAAELLAPVADLQVVGGAVRDLAAGRRPKDLDLRVHGIPEAELVALLQGAVVRGEARVSRTGDHFPVWRLLVGKAEVEIAMPRMEDPNDDHRYISDHRVTPEEDSARRDFTMNGVAVSLRTGLVLDPFGGLADATANRLRTVGERSFVGDPARMLRALVRVAAGAEPMPELVAQMARHARLLAMVAPDRIGGEFTRVLAGPDVVRALRLAEETRVLDQVMPELRAQVGYDQGNRWHSLELWEHTLGVVGRCCELTEDVEVRAAALLHDVGKPDSRTEDARGAHYHGHEDAGARTAEGVLRRLRWSEERVERVGHLVANHMFDARDFDIRRAARFLGRMHRGLDGFLAEDKERLALRRALDLVDLREADQGAHASPNDGNARVMRAAIEGALAARIPTARHQLTLGGTDLIAMGLTPGPEFRIILEGLQALVAEGRVANEAEALRKAVVGGTAAAAGRAQEPTIGRTGGQGPF